MQSNIPSEHRFRELIRPFPASLIQAPAPGKFGTYVNHADVTQAALRIVGPHDFKVVELIRGYAPEIKTEKRTYPARENAVVGVIGELSYSLGGGTYYTIREIGSEDNPAMSNDGDNAKNAASDAYKRCWMRAGLGLHLWPKKYWLDKQFDKDAETWPQQDDNKLAWPGADDPGRPFE